MIASSREYFEGLFDYLKFDCSAVESSLNGIAAKLGQEYYDSEDGDDHLYIVGSVGRRTAIRGCSDVDVVFDMPQEKFNQYNQYAGNGQSALLQDVKNALAERYPNTDIRGDGQVVVVSFEKYAVEIVPGFRNADKTFTYPDTHNGGSWKSTNPIAEQEACAKLNIKAKGAYTRLCKIIRCWKNNVGLVFHGIALDTLVFNFLANNDYDPVLEPDYMDLTIRAMEYIADNLDNNLIYYAPGSRDAVEVKGDEAKRIARLAKKFAKEVLDVDDRLVAFADCLGCPIDGATRQSDGSVFRTEQFINSKFPVDIRFKVRLDGFVTSKIRGFRNFNIRERGVSLDRPIPIKCEIRFFVDYTDCPEPYDVYWKVRNVGRVAEEKDCIRGQIFADNNGNIHDESTSFWGPHFVECYIVKNGVCVASDRIDVPIG